MAKYHKYVFDVEQRKFIGNFEEMYQAEKAENFDSWHQEDSRQLQRKIDLAILEEFNFKNILDIGCGKGYFTHLLKKRNNIVTGIDISKTAISTAKERFPDIEFKTLDVNKVQNYVELTKALGKFNLVFTSEVLSYIQNWKKLLIEISKSSEYFMVSLYIPENPIGFVKSEKELLDEVKKSFNILEHISLNKSNFTIIFAKSKNI